VNFSHIPKFEILGCDNVLHGEMESPNADAQKVLAAIPEAIMPSCRSKRTASTTDQSPLEQVERIKAAHNLDSTQKQGNK
jgi:hypothetical protein